MTVKLNAFPSLPERNRIAALKKYRQLYENEQLAVLKLHELIRNQYQDAKHIIYLSHAIPARVTDFYGDFVQGDVDRLIIRAGTGQQSDIDWVEDVVYTNELKEGMSDYAEDQSQFGFVVFLGWTDDESKYHIDSVPADQYFPQPDGSVIFATYRKDPDFPDSNRLLLHTQHYYKDGDTVKVDHQAFRCNEHGVAIEDYDLAKMGELLGRTLEATVTIPNITELPIRQADNSRRINGGFGKSDYHDIMPQLAEINERTTHTATQLLKNLDAKMVVPESNFDEEGKLTYKEAFAIESKDDPMPAYIINSNPLLTDLETHVMRELKFVEWVTGVPMWALTKGSAPERVDSLRIQLFAAVRKTAKKRSKIKRALQDMFRIGAKMTGQSEELQNSDVIIDFADILPVDELVQVQTESEKVRSGLSSRKGAMIRIENISEEDAEAELTNIRNEDQIAGIGGGGTPPAL